ncbi:hypothetical protein GW17_00053389, partial [Ensete ventricosum]
LATGRRCPSGLAAGSQPLRHGRRQALTCSLVASKQPLAGAALQLAARAGVAL